MFKSYIHVNITINSGVLTYSIMNITSLDSTHLTKHWYCWRVCPFFHNHKSCRWVWVIMSSAELKHTRCCCKMCTHTHFLLPLASWKKHLITWIHHQTTLVSVTTLIQKKQSGTGREELMSFYLVSEKWDYTGDLGLISCCKQDDVQCLKNTQTFPHLCSYICRSRYTRQFELVCATATSDLEGSLITGWPGCLDNHDEWSSPWEIV